MASAPSLTFRPYLTDERDDADTAELLNFLQSEAENARDSDLDEQRASALKAYQGDPYPGDSDADMDGRSKAITRDVSEVIDFMLTGIMGVVLAGGKAVEFETEPEMVPDPDGQPGPNGEPAMKRVDYGAEATAAVQYHFFKKQGGYRILHDCAKAGMLEKTGIIKTYAERRAPRRQSAQVPAGVLDFTAAEPTLDGMRIVEAEPSMADEAAMLDPAEQLWDVTVETPEPPVVRDVCVPNEWFLVSPDTVELDDAPYVGDRTPVTISKLVAMGYDWERIRELWDAAPADTSVEYARDSDRSKSRQSIGSRNNAQRVLWLHEEYPLFDMDGDGIAERLFVHRIGHEVLNVMEVAEQPYSGWSPVPMPHRFTGQSMADKTMDIQRIRTALLRNGLDSQYLANIPRMTVNMDGATEDTIDDILTVRPGALVRYKGGIPPVPLATSDTSAGAFAAMEMMSAERDGRTGVTRQSQGQNPDTTNKTASGMAMLQANADQIELYVTRNFAEGILASIFAKRYRLMRQHMRPFKMKLGADYVMVDPSKWPEEPDMQINVGLGTGTKEQRIGYRSQLLQVQETIASSDSDIVGDQEIYNLVADLIEDAGIGVPTNYIKDPSKMPPKPPQEAPQDPNVIKAQGDAQAVQAKIQADAAKAQGELQAKQMRDRADVQLAAQKMQDEAALRAQSLDYDLQAKREAAELDNQLKRDRAIEETRLAQERFQFDTAMAIRRAEFDERMAERRAAAQASEGNGGLPKLRPGGEIDK